MYYVNHDITINVSNYIFDESNIKIPNNKNISFNVCDAGDIAKSGHGPRVKIMINGSEAYSLSPVHTEDIYVKGGTKKISYSDLPHDYKKIYNMARTFTTDNADLIREYQNYRKPPSLSRVKEIDDILRKYISNMRWR